MKTWKRALLWLLAFILTAALAVYQRLTGPTYPLSGRESVSGGTVSYRLPRSHTARASLPVAVRAPDARLSGTVAYKRFKTDDAWSNTEMKREGDTLQASLPGQPAAGKLEYVVKLFDGEQRWELNGGRGIVARFKNAVPGWLLVVHVIFMFAGMLLAFRSGLEALRRQASLRRLVPLTLIVTVLGGLVLGPIIQKIAFGAFWTGFPLGSDPTDTKTLLAALFWLLALLFYRRSRFWVAAALLMMIAVYLIPHSILGSELDFRSGKVQTGRIRR